MPEQPGAGRLDPETLAAYIDGLLPPEERARVDAEIAADPETYEWVVNSIGAVDDPAVARPVEPERTSAATPAPTPAPVREPAPHNGNGVERKVLPFYRRRSVQGLLGTLLAAAAALVMVVRTQPVWWQEVWGPSVDPHLAKLVEAVGEEGYIEARLTGGFKYGPVRQVTRGPGDLSRQNLQLLATAGELQKRADTDPSAENLHAWGVAQLLLGDLNGAITSLSVALGDHGDKGVEIDLSAAYITRSRANAMPADAVLALRLLDGANGGRSSPERSFNRAIALELIGARSQALDAWTNYLSLEPQGPWRQEALRRIAALETPSPSSRHDRSPLLPSEASSVLLTNVAGCLAAGRSCRHLVLRLRADAATERAVTGDLLLSDFAADLESIENRPTQRSGAIAIVNLMRAVHAADEDDRLTAERLLTHLSPSPPFASFTTTVDVYRSVAASDDSSFTHRAAELEDMANAAIRRKYLRLGAVALNWSALAHLRAGRLEAALDARSRSLRLYVQVNDAVLAAELSALVAEHYRLAGAWEQAWSYHERSLRALSVLNVPRTQHVVYAHAALTALAMGAIPLATRFQTALLANAKSWGFPAAIVSALTQRARSRLLSGQTSSALSDISEARVVFAQMGQSAYAARVDAEITEVNAAANVASGDPEAVSAAKQAIDSFKQAGLTDRLVTANVLLATAYSSLHDSESAAWASREALRQWSDEAQAVQSEELEQPLSAALQELSRHLAEIAYDRHDAIGFAEAVDVGHGARFDPGDFSETLTLQKPGHCALVYAQTIESGLVGALFSRAGHRLASLGMSQRETLALVQKVRAAIQRPKSDYGHQLSFARRSLFAPFEFTISACLSLSIVPTDELSGLPFAAFPTADGTPMFNAVTVALEATSLRAVLGPRSVTPRVPKNVWILGSSAIGRADALLAVPQELSTVARLYHRSAVTTGVATPGSLERAFAEADVLHYAGHAVADPRQTSRSYLQLDGPLGSYPLSRLRGAKSSPDVVVLAACQTAFAGEEQAGAMLGIARSALSAGAKSVVGTLWDVPDADAARFSVLLHVELSAGVDAPSALRQAQRRALASAAVPFSTVAAFVVAGTAEAN